MSKRSKKPCPVDCTVEYSFGFGRSLFNIMSDPGYLFADVDNGQHILVQAGFLDNLAEGMFVHQRGAGRHNHSVETVFFDVIGDHFLAGSGTHEPVITGNNNIRQG